MGFEKTYPGEEYDADECLFLKAIQRYMRETNSPFPSFVEVLRVAKSLGWQKVSPAAPVPAEPAAVKTRKKIEPYHRKKKRGAK